MGLCTSWTKTLAVEPVMPPTPIFLTIFRKNMWTTTVPVVVVWCRVTCLTLSTFHLCFHLSPFGKFQKLYCGWSVFSGRVCVRWWIMMGGGGYSVLKASVRVDVMSWQAVAVVVAFSMSVTFCHLPKASSASYISAFPFVTIICTAPTLSSRGLKGRVSTSSLQWGSRIVLYKSNHLCHL